MESKAEKSVRKDGFEISAANGSGSDSLTDSGAEFRDSSTSSSSRSSSDASLAPLGWPIRKAHVVKSSISDVSLGDIKSHKDHPNLKKLGPKISATVFGQLWRLEPLPLEKKSMWQREMEWLLCVSDHIVELIPAWQTFPYGSKLECEDQRCHVLLRENTILKRAVAMQHERQKEYDDRNQERAQAAEGFH